CPRNPCAKAAIDIALHDLKGKVLKASIGSLLGGASQARIPTTVSIGIDDPARTKEKAVAAAKQGFTVLKLKGGRDVAQDIRNLTMVREAVGEDGPWLRLDANGGWVNRNEVYRYLPQIEALRLRLLEQ